MWSSASDCSHFRLSTASALHSQRRSRRPPQQQIRCLPSYVTALPPADLKATSLALDLGGTNFRVCSVKMDKGTVELDQEKFAIPAEAKASKDLLFDFLAQSIKTFLDKRPIEGGKGGQIELGFTFSFPVQQTSLDSGKLIAWTKGFNAPGVVGEDVVALLQAACVKVGLPNVHVAALVNDTVGTMMAYAVKDVDTRIGMIVGTGSNACYAEKREKVTKMGGKRAKDAEWMVINLECGNFGSESNILPLTKYDKATIDNSTAPKEQWIEKLVSGKYLGEIARHAILDLHARGALCKGQPLAEKFQERHSLDTEILSRAGAKPLVELSAFFEETIGIKTSETDNLGLVAIFDAVGKRSAFLCGGIVAGLIEHMGKACTVAVDGSVFEHYPHFQKRMKKAIVELLGEETGSKVKLELGKDGSGVGAGVIAAVA
ncbi:hypothetical protein DFJ74DRAFT_699878 [Hyaloraphidium curvatum]|nr:hypothetical protein DFJ74DRAFT_699878 [Hyaloraphidium curvatum]